MGWKVLNRLVSGDKWSNWTGFNGIDALNGLVVVGWEVLVPFPSEYALTNDAVGTCQLSSNTSNVPDIHQTVRFQVSLT